MTPLLYHAHMSVCSQKARIALAEKGVTWKDRFLDLPSGDQFKPDYLKLNPNAVVPTLVHDGRVLIESTLICEYVDDAFDGPPLKPADPYERYRMRLWTKQLDDSVHAATGTISFAMVLRHTRNFPTAEALETHLAKIRDPARRDRQRATIQLGCGAPHVRAAAERFATLCADMEAQLSRSAWLAGDSFSLADVGLIPYVTRLNRLCLDFLWADRPALAGWFDRVRGRASYRVAVEDYVTSKADTHYARYAPGEAPKIRALLDGTGGNRDDGSDGRRKFRLAPE